MNRPSIEQEIALLRQGAEAGGEIGGTLNDLDHDSAPAKEAPFSKTAASAAIISTFRVPILGLRGDPERRSAPDRSGRYYNIANAKYSLFAQGEGECRRNPYEE